MNKKVKKIMSITLALVLAMTTEMVTKAEITNKTQFDKLDMGNLMEMVSENNSLEINLEDDFTEEQLKVKLQDWSNESLLPVIDLLSLATPQDSGTAKATVEYTISGVEGNTIQNFAIGSSYIYVTQHNGTDTRLSRCTITSSTDTDGSIIATYKDSMILKNFGHGETLAMTTYNGATYFYVGAECNTSSDSDWSKQIARIKYSAGTTLESDNASRISHLNRANSSGTSVGTVWRSACAISSTQVVFRTQVESGKVQYSFFPLSAINDAFDTADGKSSKEVSFYGNETLQKKCTKSFVQSTEDDNLVSPNGSFQGMDLTNGGNIYIAGGGYTDKYNRVAKMSSTGSYKYRWDITGLGQYNNEIEGVKARNTKVLFAIRSQNSNYNKKIFSAPVD